MEQVELPTLHCYRCGATWRPRSTIVRICARCKSPYWDEPRIRVPKRGTGAGFEQIILPKRRAILAVARRYGARNVRVFGSVARYDAGPKSDVDFLVDLTGPWHGKGSRLYRMTRELESILGRSVDLVSEETLHWFIEPQIVAEATPV